MLADEILVVGAGNLLQAGPRREVSSQSATPQVARLIGVSSLLPGEVSEGHIRAGSLEVDSGAVDRLSGPAIWAIRPEHVVILLTGGFLASVRDVIELATETEVPLEPSPDLVLRARTEGTAPPPRGECTFDIPSERLLVRSAATDQLVV